MLYEHIMQTCWKLPRLECSYIIYTQLQIMWPVCAPPQSGWVTGTTWGLDSAAVYRCVELKHKIFFFKSAPLKCSLLQWVHSPLWVFFSEGSHCIIIYWLFHIYSSDWTPGSVVLDPDFFSLFFFVTDTSHKPILQPLILNIPRGKTTPDSITVLI